MFWVKGNNFMAEYFNNFSIENILDIMINNYENLRGPPFKIKYGLRI